MHQEAQRQRASKCDLLAMLINKPNQKEDVQSKITKHVERLLNPHSIHVVVDYDKTWEELRASRGLT
jgi:hypothetical protein